MATNNDYSNGNGGPSNRSPKHDDTDSNSISSMMNRLRKNRFSLLYLVAAISAVLVISNLTSAPPEKTIDYSKFKQLVSQGAITTVQIGPDYYVGTGPAADKSNAGGTQAVNTPSRYRTVAVNDPGFIPLLDKNGVHYYAIPSRMNPLLGFLLNWIVPFAVMFVIWRLLARRLGNGAGADVLSFGKNRAQVAAEGDTGVRFADVAGCDEAKSELEEVVDFLKRPERYTAIGGKIPKGVLLVGVPGTGKTLLARAVAGEAGVPFFKMSGADFVEMFVGVGAARVRDLFRQAREKSPCIIFIDELDAIGKRRVTGMATNDEREQTLNQLLVELDGFDSRTGVIILGATNRPEILDPALLRPGRFDRQVAVDKPDVEGREAILRIHTRGLSMDDSVDLRKVARSTPGMSGADLANLANEAALLAVRADRQKVMPEDFEEAVEKVVAGLKKKKRLLDPQERRRVAIHETGHALAAHFTPGADPVHKISIIPRGIGALGYTMQLPPEERYLMTERELLAQVDVLLGGRAAEQLVTGEISTGAADDLSRATDIVRRMLTEYGMSTRFPNVYLPSGRPAAMSPEGASMYREYSESTQQYVDEETARIIAERFERVSRLLSDRRVALDEITEKLLVDEVIDADQFAGIVSSHSKPAVERAG
ncbi:ATP-dependent zinc metalloprotease FtsH [Salinispira pacifica]